MLYLHFSSLLVSRAILPQSEEYLILYSLHYQTTIEIYWKKDIASVVKVACIDLELLAIIFDLRWWIHSESRPGWTVNGRMSQNYVYAYRDSKVTSSSNVATSTCS